MNSSDRPTLVLWTSLNCLLTALALPKHGGPVERGLPEGGVPREGWHFSLRTPLGRKSKLSFGLTRPITPGLRHCLCLVKNGAHCLILLVGVLHRTCDCSQGLRGVRIPRSQASYQLGSAWLPLSGRVFEVDKIPGQPTAGLDGTLGMAPCTAFQTPVQRTCQHRQQTATTRSMDRQGPTARLPIHRGGLPGSSCKRNPCLCTGARSSRNFRTGWGLSAAEEGREELRTQSRAGNTNVARLFPGRTPSDPPLRLATASGPA